MARWRRVHTPRSFFEMGFGMVAAGVVFLVVAVVATVRQPAAAVGLVFVLLWTSATVRITQMGIHYGERGVRSRSLLHTRVVPWESVQKFEDRMAVSNPWALGSSAPARAIWIVRWDGDAIQTPLVYQIAQFYRDGSHDPPSPRNRWIWTEQECQAALKQLNQILTRARRHLARDAEPNQLD